MTTAQAVGAVSREAAEWYGINWPAIHRNVRQNNDAQLFAQTRTLRIRQSHSLDFSTDYSTSPLGPLRSYLCVIFIRFRGPAGPQGQSRNRFGHDCSVDARTKDSPVAPLVFVYPSPTRPFGRNR